MNTEKINNVLKRLCTENFDGVFSVDNLPEKPRLLVANTDPANRPGRHWVCIYADNGLRKIFRFAWTSVYCKFRALFKRTLLVVDI